MIQLSGICFELYCNICNTLYMHALELDGFHYNLIVNFNMHLNPYLQIWNVIIESNPIINSTNVMIVFYVVNLLKSRWKIQTTIIIMYLYSA